MQNYLKVEYDSAQKPVTTYPDELAKYLFDRYDMKKGMRLLDNGCGRGDFLYAFERLGLETFGTDVNKGCEKTQVMNLNSDNLPFEDGFFDVVFSKSVLEHIERQEHFMNEMYRVLSPRGGYSC